MSNDTTRRTFTTGLAVAATSSLAGCSVPFTGSRAQTETARTVAPEGTKALTIRNELGRVEVGVGNVDRVEIEQSKTVESGSSDLSKLQLQTERNGEEMHLEPNWTGLDQGLVSSPSVDLTVTVPESLRVQKITTEGGTVSVTGVTGTVGVKTAGDVTVDDTEGVSDLISAAGAVEADVNSLDGDTLFRSNEKPVTARIADDLDAVVRVDTESGQVNFEGDFAGESTDATRPELTVGEGGPTLSLSTVSGDVTVTRQR